MVPRSQGIQFGYPGNIAAPEIDLEPFAKDAQNDVLSHPDGAFGAPSNLVERGAIFVEPCSQGIQFGYSGNVGYIIVYKSKRHYITCLLMRVGLSDILWVATERLVLRTNGIDSVRVSL